MEIITRKQAIQNDLKYYFTGKPCNHGHIEERRVSNFACTICEKTHSATWYQANKAYYKKYYAANRKDLLQYSREYWKKNGHLVIAKRKLNNESVNV
jgi:hypothetical protein